VSRRVKQPGHSASASHVKRPHVSGQPADPFQLGPTWRFSGIDMDGPFGWKDISGQDLRDVKDYLVKLERMKWSEIFQRRSGNHQPQVVRISPAARRRLGELGIEVERLVSLRMTNMKRIWGIRDEAVCSVLWWDPRHEVFPSKRR